MSTARMQPLASLPSALLRGVRGVLTDIDDTLTHNGAMEAASLEALYRLHASQLPVIAITGRPAGWSETFATQWPVQAIVAENGGVLLRAGSSGLVREFAQAEHERARNFERLQACAAAVLRAIPAARLASDSSGRLTDIAIDHGEFAHLDRAAIEQVVALLRRHGLNASVSSIHINGWIGAHDKWTGAQWAVQRCTGAALDAGDWIYVGDSANDELMFERIPLSVAVANIAPFVAQLHALPAYVTRGERGAGFAELAAALLTAHGVSARAPGSAA